MNTIESLKIARQLLLAAVSMVMTVQAETSAVVSLDSYHSYQVNVSANGQNINGDKGNEPSIAVNPLNPNNIVIGWRRFDSMVMTKQAGYGYSLDGGESWTNGVLPALESQQRTDPVLDTDSQGNFYYQSMAHGSVNSSSVFKSTDGGASWSDPVHQFIGDKNWIAIDKTSGDSNGNIYSSWRRAGSTHPDPDYVPKYFIRSTDGGISYQEPDEALPVSNLGFGRIAIGMEGEVYLSGVSEDVISSNAIGIIRKGHYFLKSTNAKDPEASPSFSAQKVDMGGDVIMLFMPTGPNPLGSYGDVQIATDLSAGTMSGNIYMLAYALPHGWKQGADPLDLFFVRSEDGGDSWSAPMRINDDVSSSTAFQWFPMLGVAPNSRIDAVWYDTRNGTGDIPARMSQLFYAYSWDGGETWSENQPVTQAFNTHLPNHIVNGVERQADKIGDYSQLLSDENGAHVAYAATFNGEQDVYYLNVFPDCNENGISDVLDISQGSSQDQDASYIPDECEISMMAGDLDNDGDIDRDDINIILASRNQAVTDVNDPKDVNGDGRITVTDVRKLMLECTRPRCATK